MRVMLVEDDATLRRGLCRALEQMGHQVQAIEDGEHADTLLGSEHVDLVVLDLGLPKLDGLEVLRRLRARKQKTPVLILSARGETADRVAGLDAGADDYLGKPFDLTEFEARVRAMLRRGEGERTRIGPLEWSWSARSAFVDGALLPLSPRELTLLESLVQQPGHVTDKDVIAQRLGNEEAPAGENTVEVYVHRLRRKLKPYGVEILNVRGLGYLLREARQTATHA